MLASGKAPAPPGWEAVFRVPCPQREAAVQPVLPARLAP